MQSKTLDIEGWLFLAWCTTIFLVFSSSFHEMYLAPKSLAFVIGTPLLFFFLSRQPNIQIPSKGAVRASICFIAICVVGTLFSPRPQISSIYLTYLIGSFVLYLFLLNAPDQLKTKLLDLLAVIAVLQVAILTLKHFTWSQWLIPESILAIPRAVGTIGNAEFLSTLLGVSFFVALRYWLEKASWQSRVASGIVIASSMAGLVVAQSKGTLFLLIVIPVAVLLPRTRKYIVASAGIGFIFACFFMVSARGRIFLWIIGSVVTAKHFIIGVGPAEFGNHYLDTIDGIFRAFPRAASAFGDLSGNILESHNLILQLGAEGGIIGGIFGALLLAFGFRCSFNLPKAYCMALWLILIKSLYTVTLSPPTGMILFLTLLAMGSRDSVLFKTPRFAGGALLLAIAGLHATAFWYADALYQRGHRALFIGDLDQAEHYLLKSIKLNPENGESFLDLAYLAFKKRDTVRMESNIQESLIRLKTLNTYKLSARMEVTSGNIEAARQKYEYLHHIFPEHITSITRLAEIYLAQGKLGQARQLAMSVLTSSPRVPTKSHDFNLIWADHILEEITKAERTRTL